MKKYDKQRLFEVMSRLDKTFKPKRLLKESMDTFHVEEEYELPENQIKFTIEGDASGDGDLEWFDLKEGSYDEQYIDIIKEWMASNVRTIKDDLAQNAINQSSEYGDYEAGRGDEYRNLSRDPMKEDEQPIVPPTEQSPSENIYAVGVHNAYKGMDELSPNNSAKWRYFKSIMWPGIHSGSVFVVADHLSKEDAIALRDEVNKKYNYQNRPADAEVYKEDEFQDKPRPKPHPDDFKYDPWHDYDRSHGY